MSHHLCCATKRVKDDVVVGKSFRVVAIVHLSLFPNPLICSVHSEYARM